MKRLRLIFISLIITFLIPIISCNKETVNLGPIGDSEATYYQNEKQMEAAVMGTYQKLAYYYIARSFTGYLTGIYALPDDDLTTAGNDGYEFFVSVTGTDGRLNSFYQFSYQLIARANVVLQKIEENGSFAYSLQPELKNYHKGEVLFLRSYAYFLLWNTFGSAAPLVTERITNMDNAYPSSSKGNEFLDKAIADLQEALTLLPDNWSAQYKGRVTKNSARALRGKILVFRGHVSTNKSDFTEALSAFNSISGASLMPNYGDNFNVAKENNAESFFEYQANEQVILTNPSLDNDSFVGNGDLGFWCGIFSKQPSSVQTYYATQSLINAYEPGDPRLQYTIDPKKGITNVIKYTRDGNPMTVGAGANNNIQRNNPRILRYADVLLLKAEAIVRSGGSTSDAINIINQIRQRARMSTTSGPQSPVPANLNTTETNTKTILDWIYKERRIELACEQGHRWYDLRRRHIAGEIDLKKWDFSSARIDFKFQDFNLVFPIPTNEVVQNPKLVQNIGYQ